MQLQLFGGPILEEGGRPIALSPFQAALVAIAFSEGRQRLPRRFVKELLWQDANEKSTRHRLSQLVYQIGRKTEARLMELEGETLRTHLHLVHTDVDDFEEYIRRPDYRAAKDLMERGFLKALSSAPTDAFEDWWRDRELALRASLREKALGYWSEQAGRHDWGRAKDAAEALLSLDPGNEEGLRRVMKARAMGGMVREAEAVYAAFAERAGGFEKWVPDEETTELLGSVRAAAEGKPLVNKDIVVRDLEVALCGRDDELAFVTRATFGDRRKDRPRAVIVGGEAGMGKTRLVTEALQGARFRGHRVLRARPAELEQNIPLNPLIEALDEDWVGELVREMDDPWRAVLLSVMPQFHEGDGPLPEVPYLDPEKLPRRTYEAFLRLFQRIGALGPTLLFIDDFQWADDASASALQFLFSRWGENGPVLILTYRPEEMDEDRPVGRLVKGFEAGSDATALMLEELGEDEAGGLVRSVATTALPDERVSEVVQLAGGNPFFLIELAAEAVRGVGESAIGLPESVLHLVSRRVERLEEEPREVLGALAVVGQTVPFGVVASMSGLPRNQAVDALELLQDLRLVQWFDGGVRTRHDIVRSAVYNGMSPARRALLHGRVAAVLEAEAADAPADQLAVHYYRAGERDKALRYALEAADHASSRTPAAAIRYVKIALEFTASESRRLPLIHRLGILCHQAGDLEQAITWLEQASAPLREWPGKLEAAVLRIHLQSELGRITPREAMSAFSELGRLASDRRDHRVVVETLERRLRLVDRGEAHADDVVDIFREAERISNLEDAGDAAKCGAHCVLVLHLFFGDHSRAAGYGRLALEFAKRPEAKELRARAFSRYLMVAAYTGSLASADVDAVRAEGISLTLESGDLSAKYLFQQMIANWWIDIGELDRAQAEYESLRKQAHSSEPRLLVNWLANTCSLLIDRGDYEAAIHRLEKAERLVVAGTPRYLLDALRSAKGIGLLRLGRFREAKGLLGQCDEIPDRWMNDLSWHVMLRAELAAAERGWKAGDAVYEMHERRVLERLPLCWVKLRRSRIRLARRNQRSEEAKAQIRSAVEITRGLGFPDTVCDPVASAN